MSQHYSAFYYIFTLFTNQDLTFPQRALSPLRAVMVYLRKLMISRSTYESGGGSLTHCYREKLDALAPEVLAAALDKLVAVQEAGAVPSYLL
jgi:hypothetical protein